MTLQEQLAEMEARANAATEGPWEFNVSTVLEAALWLPEWDGRLWMKADKGTSVDDWKMSENAQFIAHARTDIPKLLVAVRLLRSQCNYFASSRGDSAQIREALDAELAALLGGANG